jgi:hypothetical protein
LYLRFALEAGIIVKKKECDPSKDGCQRENQIVRFAHDCLLLVFTFRGFDDTSSAFARTLIVDSLTPPIEARRRKLKLYPASLTSTLPSPSQIFSDMAIVNALHPSFDIIPCSMPPADLPCFAFQGTSSMFYASQPVSQSASQPVSQSASKPVSKSANQPTNLVADLHREKLTTLLLRSLCAAISCSSHSSQLCFPVKYMFSVSSRRGYQVQVPTSLPQLHAAVSSAVHCPECVANEI